MEILKETIEFIEFLDYITIVFAFFAMIGTFVNFFYRRKDSKLIKIYIKFPDNSTRLVPYHITRRNFTRSELFGILRAIDKEGSFNIKYTSTPEFFDDVLQVQKGKSDEITIRLETNDKFSWAEI